MGYDRESVEMKLYSCVHFVRDGVEVSMSKRAGDFITLDELLSEVGVDAARFLMLQRSHETTVDLDLELARRQSQDNPVYYVQYAHARIASILRKASDAGLVPATDVEGALVTTLYSGTAVAGYHELHWNGERADGVRVSSGIYLCRLRAGNQVLTRKMALVQ